MAIKRQVKREIVRESGVIARECALHVSHTIEEHRKTVDLRIADLYTMRGSDLATIGQMKQDLKALVDAFGDWKEGEGKQIREIHTTVRQISMVKLNGGPEIPIGEAMRELWMATAGIRSWGKVAQSWHEWQSKTAFGRFTKTKIGRILVLGAVAFVCAAVLDFVGIVTIDIAAATKWMLQLIFRHGVNP